MKKIRPVDCECDGIPSLCPACLIRFAVTYERQRGQRLSIAMIRRRVPGLGHREAALLVEFSKRA